MKNNNNIDQLFESKLNNQSFELKDSYMADFEDKLDVHNKKGKGYFWLIYAVASMSLGIVYDYLILPNYNAPITEQANNKTEHSTNRTLNIAAPVKATKSKSQETNIQASESNFENEISTTIGSVENEIPTTQTSASLVAIKSKKDSISPDNYSYNNYTDRQSNAQSSNTNKDIKPLEISRGKNTTGQINATNHIDKVKGESQENIPIDIITTNSPSVDVYIDDTIRRQVIIIDTIVKKDTIIITDTIKRQFRLFKKKI